MMGKSTDVQKKLADWLGDSGKRDPAETDPLLADLDALYAGQPAAAAVDQALQALQARLRQEHPVLYYGELATSPVGPISVALSEAGLVAVEFGEAGPEFLEHLQRNRRAEAVRSPERAGPVLQQLEEYFAGKRGSFNVPVDLSHSTGFQRQVLQAAARVPRGGLATYAEIARHIGKPRASRAVGQALARNPVPIVIPCHRVVAADGSLTGYSGRGGIRTKARLLVLEGVSSYAAALS
jgi:methylated-DNA-[protein]-cysteine S-methyltransferase